jgi:predicted TIM-barrel fold metal-dependent hydrolase
MEVLMNNQPHRIDVHHHILPPEYVHAAARYGVGEAGGFTFPSWTADAALSLMDRAGIATAMTSVSAPGAYFGDRAAARELARRCNEISARLVSDHPSRFGAFALLTLPDVDGSLEELSYALDTLRLDGVVLFTSIGDRYLGDPAFESLFAELNRRKAVVFVHPTMPSTSQGVRISLPAAIIEFVFDTTRAIANLIFSGTLERYPDISMIFSHAGGTAPYLAERLSAEKVIPKLREKAPQGAIAYLKRLYYDTAISTSRPVLSALRELVDPSHVLYGSDYPYLPEPLIHEMNGGLEAYREFTPGTRAAIERENALALFPRLRMAQEALR